MIEQTMNRESNIKGGISLNRGAVQRWILTVHDRAKTLQTSREMTSIYDSESKQHKDASVPRMKEDNNDVHKGMDTIESWINPFKSRDPNEPLSSIASGVKTTDDIAEHLLTAEQKGNDAFTTFVEKRLQTSDVDLFAQRPNAKLQTFQNLVMSKKTKAAESDIVIKADRSLFARMDVIAQHRRMSMQDVFMYPFGPLPWSIATSDGAPAKTFSLQVATILFISGKAENLIKSSPYSRVTSRKKMERSNNFFSSYHVNMIFLFFDLDLRPMTLTLDKKNAGIG